LKDNVRLVSRVPRGATIRLPGTGSEADPAVVADSRERREFAASASWVTQATPLGTGVLVRHSDLAIVDVEVTGAVSVAIAINDTAAASLLASDITTIRARRWPFVRRHRESLTTCSRETACPSACRDP
jgi:hypothetical protein